MWWLIVLVIVVIAYLYSRGQTMKKEQQKEVRAISSSTAEVVTITTRSEQKKELQELQEVSETADTVQSFSRPSFELIDFMTPRLKKDMRVIEGSNRIIVWDSPRVNLLRKQFQVKNVMQRLEFQDEAAGKIEVYRALADDRVVSFVFPNENDDSDIIPLLPRSTSDDPSGTPSRNKEKSVLDVTKAEPDNVPSDLLPLIRDLQMSYAARQSSSGPKAVDTHRS